MNEKFDPIVLVISLKNHQIYQGFVHLWSVVAIRKVDEKSGATRSVSGHL
jgi:hypothetical protein